MVSCNDKFWSGFLFAERKRWNGEVASSKVKLFIRHFTEKDVVLDIGCGVELSVVSDFAQYVVGLDIDPDFLRVAKEALGNKTKKNVELVRGDAYLPFKTSSFSKLLCFDILEHLPNPRRLVDGIKEVLCQRSFCVIRIPNKWTIHEFLLMLVSRLKHGNKGSLWNVRHVSFFMQRLYLYRGLH